MAGNVVDKVADIFGQKIGQPFTVVGEELKASHRRVYYERKGKGLCVCCGKSAPVEGLTRCQKCREKVNADYRRRYHEQKDIDMCDLMCR